MLWDAFPMYLAFGMTPEEYWNGPPELASAYRRKYMLEREIANENMWLQGLYFEAALQDVLSSLLEKKGAKHKSMYPEKPLRITPYTEEELIAKRTEEAKKAREHAIAQFNAMKAAWDKKNGGS